MPRVSDAHLAARRSQILDAARRCFARNGFHATSMQDVISEAGLSVGAVYRYFKSKEELRIAVTEATTSALLSELGTVADHTPPLPLTDALVQVFELIEPRLAEPDSVARIAIQAWGEALRDPDLGRYVTEILVGLRRVFVGIATSAVRAGDLPPGADPDAVGAVLMALVPGYLLQRVLIGGPDQATFAAGIRALLPTAS